MESLAIRFPRSREHPDESLIADLLEALQRMVRRGHLPSSALVVTLTDARIRVNASVENRTEALERLLEIRNEYGPVRRALWISVERRGPIVRLGVEPLVSTSGAELPQAFQAEARIGSRDGAAQAFAGEGSAVTVDFSVSSRYSAMRDASLGITTGWLPNVDSISLPSGARSWLV